MIHPDVQKVIDYPETMGKRVAMLKYKWNKLTVEEEAYYASAILNLAKLIDVETDSEEWDDDID